MSHNRSFSFESNQGRTHQYVDSPERLRVISPPPPGYSSTTHAFEPVSPVSSRLPTPQPSQSGSRYDRSFEVPRRPVANYHEVVPPHPPPHRSNDLHEAQRSVTYTAMDSADHRLQGTGWDRARGEEPDYTQQRMRHSSAQEPLSSTVRNQHYTDQDHSHRDPYSQERPSHQLDRTSYGSTYPLAAGTGTHGQGTTYEYPDDGHFSETSSRSHTQTSYYGNGQAEHYNSASPYHTSGYHSRTAIHDAEILPQDIADDGDDGFMPAPKRKSRLPLSRERSRERAGATVAGGAGVGGMLGGLVGRREKNIASSGSYNVVPGQHEPATDKSEWLSRQKRGNNKMRWIVGFAIGAVVVIALIGGIVGGVLGNHNSSSGGSSSSNGDINNAASDTAANGDLDLNSAQIKALMNNKNMHRVFPGMDYTPWGTQYPLCLTYPPSQNNVTRDMAVLSQLTNSVRLYGTDCNQTEMVLHAIDRLKLTSMKVWLGVWVDSNTTTTQRQLDQMYKILASTKDLSIFKGVIVGNEALFRAGVDKATTEQELITILTGVKSNFTNLGYKLPVSTSDLGDNWDGQIAQVSDYVMSNIHPFFAGVNVNTAAAWTWNFWQMKDVALQTDLKKQVISETGWPSGGGTDCGNTQNICAAGQTGAVANVNNMNTFMADWVCQALTNGTQYFWFEAFDEAWKVVYNTPGKEWEDKWGLMDPARNLKPGLVIPNCNGQRVP